MPLIVAASRIKRATLEALLRMLRKELKSFQSEFEGPPNASRHAARLRTARDLLAAVLELTSLKPSGKDSTNRMREYANLLYSATIVAAEYYKLFVRPPKPGRPAGSI